VIASKVLIVGLVNAMNQPINRYGLPRVACVAASCRRGDMSRVDHQGTEGRQVCIAWDAGDSVVLAAAKIRCDRCGMTLLVGWVRGDNIITNVKIIDGQEDAA